MLSADVSEVPHFDEFAEAFYSIKYGSLLVWRFVTKAASCCPPQKIMNKLMRLIYIRSATSG